MIVQYNSLIWCFLGVFALGKCVIGQALCSCIGVAYTLLRVHLYGINYLKFCLLQKYALYIMTKLSFGFKYLLST